MTFHNVKAMLNALDTFLSCYRCAGGSHKCVWSLILVVFVGFLLSLISSADYFCTVLSATVVSGSVFVRIQSLSGKNSH